MKKNILFALGVLLCAAALLAARGARRDGGAARVSIAGGETLSLALGEDGVFSIEGGRLPVTLEVSGGRVRFIDSRCPDHICEGYGWLSHAQEQAVCMPAGVVVSVE